MYDDEAVVAVAAAAAAVAKSREVSPKLVVRGKKYGRRSRPQSVAAFESSQSDSEEDYDFARVPTTTTEKSPKTYHKVSCTHTSLFVCCQYVSHMNPILLYCIFTGPTVCITR